MIGGIDQQIQQRVDAYRDNPQQLMQRYQQNQELIDLLAMQKLKSEKDAAAREMQMQMQATPQTIKQQREAELLGRTKDEMVQQTSGIMQERQKRQQQNMQRTANQGLPQLPAGNMQRMAGGGIVAFAEGGDVDARMRQLIEAALELGESPEALAERLKDNPNALAILRSIQPQQVDRPRQASMGERPAEAMSIPDRAPSIDTTDIMSILNPSKPTKPVEKVVPPTRLPEKEPSAPAMGERPEEARSLPRPSTRPVSAPVTPGPRIDTTDIMSILNPSKETKPYKPLEEATAKRSPIGPDRFGGVGLYGGERAPTAEGGLASMLPERKPSMQRTEQRGMGTRGDGEPDGIVQAVSSLFDDTGDRAPTRREISEGVSAPRTAPQTTPAATPAVPELAAQPATQPATRQQQMDQLQEIDTSGLAGLKKASLTPRESYEANRSVLSKELLRQQDPEELARQRRQAFLLGGLSNQGRGGLAGAAAASERAREVQKAQKLQGIGSLMGVDEKLMTMDYNQAKLATEERAAQALESLRTMQSDTQRLNVMGGLYQDARDTFEATLMQNPEYTNALKAYEDAKEGGFFGVNEEELRAAKARVDAIEDRIKATMPNLESLESSYFELLQRMGGAQGAGGSTEGYTVERVQQ
jgi:hypothetical protein